jgi:hypothetical protein
VSHQVKAPCRRSMRLLICHGFVALGRLWPYLSCDQ